MVITIENNAVLAYTLGFLTCFSVMLFLAIEIAKPKSRLVSAAGRVVKICKAIKKVIDEIRRFK